MNANEALKLYFGYDSFREGQESIINTILAGKDALAIMPTGAGKSICYQVPALILPGITIVISPLISLMQDQVKALNEAGIHAAFINSSLSDSQIRQALSTAAQGTYKIIYVAPERLESLDFSDFAQKADISMVTVDEAHCISQWGQDFRPSYLKIVDFISGLQRRPILSAFTATATEDVKNDIACILKLRNPNIIVTGFDRENLYYLVESSKKKDDYIVEYIEKHLDESGIIYCATRKNVDSLYELLYKRGVPVTKYHAGIDNENRKKNQDDFTYDRTPVIVATNAFGMGIDKSNVRYVIHYNMPQSMENYYQEAGRAGRDGEVSQCILLFSAQDIMINKFLLERKDFSEVVPENIELIQQRDTRRLQVMEGYCRTTSCLRNYILDYFGEKTGVPCDNCGNCHREYQEVDMTNEAKWVINCLAETKGRYGLNIVLGTLLGANRARLKELGTVNYKSYGILKDNSEFELRLLISQMILEGYVYQTEDQYSVFRMGDITPLRDMNNRVMIRMYEEKEPDRRVKSGKKKSTDSLTSAGFILFEKLRNLRMEIAREESMPPYIIFSDKSLIDMCVKVPQNKSEMLNVSGVGAAKFNKYGQRFLDAIGVYQEAHPDSVISMKENDNESFITEKPEKLKRKKSTKGDFFLNESDIDKFNYADFYYISEIKDEMNRICTVNNVKKITVTKIWEYLVSEGMTDESDQGGVFIKKQTERGLALGIKTIDKISQIGTLYKILMYPEIVQKMILEYFVGSRLESGNQESEDLEEIELKNKKKNILGKRKYADWVVEYPDTVIVKKEGLFFTLRGNSAKVVGDITELNISDGPNPVTGSPSKEGITEALVNNQINYIVVIDDEIVEQETYEPNHYFDYI